MNKEEKLGICVIINDAEEDLLREIVAQNGSLEDGALRPIDRYMETGSAAYRIPLDTKYYSCEYILWNLTTFEVANKWFNNLNPPPTIFALFIKADIVNFSQNADEFFTKTRQIIGQFKANTQAIVLKTPKMEPEQDNYTDLSAKRNTLQKFCVETAELIQLNASREWNDEEDLLESNLIGIDRVVELLGVGFSDCGSAGFNQKLKSNPIGKPEHRNELERFLHSVDEDWAAETKAIPDPDDYPDSEDEAAIVAMFDQVYPQLQMPSIPLPLSSEQQSIETLMGTDYARIASLQSHRESVPKNIADESNKNKRKKTPRSKQKSDELGEKRIVSDEANEVKRLDINDVLSRVKVLQENNLRTSCIDPTKFRPGDLRFSEQLAALNESRQMCGRLPDPERIGLSEMICLEILKSMDVDDGMKTPERSESSASESESTAQTLLDTAR